MNVRIEYPAKVALFLFLILISCRSDQTVHAKEKIANNYDNVIYKPRILIYRDKNIFASAEAGMLYQNTNKDAKLIGNLVSKFYDDEGKFMSTLYADSGSINERKYSMLASGNVKLESSNGDALYTDELLWDNNNQTISSSDTVLVVSHKGDSLSGIGFESDSDLENIIFFKSTSGVYREEGSNE